MQFTALTKKTWLYRRTQQWWIQGRSWGGPPLFWVKKRELQKEEKPAPPPFPPPPPLAQGLDPPLHTTTKCNTKQIKKRHDNTTEQSKYDAVHYNKVDIIGTPSQWMPFLLLQSSSSRSQYSHTETTRGTLDNNSSLGEGQLMYELQDV